MKMIFQYVLQMSFYGSVAILAVLLLRKCFQKFPKKVTTLFWLVPGLRLLCPLNSNTVFSLVHLVTLPLKSDEQVNQVTNTVIPRITTVPGGHGVTYATDHSIERASSTAVDLGTVAAWIWLAGVVLILAYLLVQTVKMLQILQSAKKVPRNRYFESDRIETSFVLGIVNPRIYMQSGLSTKEASYVLLHERTHIHYRDHITRIVGVLTVCLHWFNPLVWIAFSRMCSDIEMRCDETVIERMGTGSTLDYCKTMVSHAVERDTSRRGLSVAFSGDNCSGREIKMRIKNLMNYKRVSRITAALVIIFALTLTIGLSTKAKNAEREGHAVSVPGNTLTEMTPEENLENYGKENFEIPDDVVYSDEGRPYSETYDFRSTPVLKKMSDIVVEDGYEILDPDTEYLDQDGNVRTGRELYCFNAWKEEGEQTMLLNFYMVSMDYALDSFNTYEERGDLMIGRDSCDTSEGVWYTTRIYDTKTGVMVDASGTYDFDWEALGLFE